MYKDPSGKPHHPPRPYPGNERRKLSAQADPLHTQNPLKIVALPRLPRGPTGPSHGLRGQATAEAPGTFLRRRAGTQSCRR